MKKIYLAGYDVFYPDAAGRGQAMKQLCKRYGFEGLYPLDNEAQSAQEILAGNLKLIEEADIVMANMNPFRGMEPDSGTAFEVGYAVGKGKRIYVYLEDCRTLRQKIGETDARGFAVEDFSLPLNLMIACSAVVVEGGLEDCLRRTKAGE